MITIVSYGAGVDSTAVLVGMAKRGERPDGIYFADTGGEKPETYHYLESVVRPWLREVGFPDVTVVRKTVARSANEPYSTLQGNCISNSTLPGLAFATKSCSQKWKAEPIDRAVNARADVKAAAARGEKVIRCIGYDAGPKDARRGSAQYETKDSKYTWRYPLREWGWDRERCEDEIRAAGLPVPMKSACWFCPANKPEEIRWLMETHPELARGIVEIERKAAPVQAFGKVKGLWGTGTKGMRGAIAKPARMTTYLASQGFEPAQSVDFAEIEAEAGRVLGDATMPMLQAKAAFVKSVLDAVEPSFEGSILVSLVEERVQRAA